MERFVAVGTPDVQAMTALSEKQWVASHGRADRPVSRHRHQTGERAKAPLHLPPPLVPAMSCGTTPLTTRWPSCNTGANKLTKSAGIPGMAVAVVHGGKTVYAKGFGVKDGVTKPADDPAKQGGPARYSSWPRCPKPIGAPRQRGQKSISWNTPVVDKLPWFGAFQT